MRSWIFIRHRMAICFISVAIVNMNVRHWYHIMITRKLMKMPKFSQTSFSRLATCHLDLQILFYEVIRHFDCSILEGHRGEEAQEKAFREKRTTLSWPNSSHNRIPSLAVDVAPYPVDLSNSPKNISRFYFFAGHVLGLSLQLYASGKITHHVRWGGDWDGDKDITDQSFNDLLHYELLE